MIAVFSAYFTSDTYMHKCMYAYEKVIESSLTILRLTYQVILKKIMRIVKKINIRNITDHLLDDIKIIKYICKCLFSSFKHLNENNYRYIILCRFF